MFKARYDSRNFTFEAFGKTEKQAIEAMHDGLELHAKQYGLPMDWWREFEGDLYVVEIAFGKCYRDNQEMGGAA